MLGYDETHIHKLIDNLTEVIDLLNGLLSEGHFSE
jgi:hypothetical protein